MSSILAARRESNAALINRIKNKHREHRTTDLFDDDTQPVIVLEDEKETPQSQQTPNDTLQEIPQAQHHDDTILKALLRKRPNSAITITQRRSEKSKSLEPQLHNNDHDTDPTVPIMQGPQRLTLHGSRLSRFYVPTSPNSLLRCSVLSGEVHFIGSLPDEVLFEVLSFLEPIDLGKCMSVCRRWNVITAEESLWQRFAMHYYPEGTRKALNDTKEQNLNGTSNSSGGLPLSRRRNSQIHQQQLQQQSAFYRTTFLKFLMADQRLSKTGIWRNDRMTKAARRNQRLEKEEYELLSEQMKQQHIRRRESRHTIKVVVVGDGAVGKTSLLCRFANNYFPEHDFLPTIFENFSQRCIINNTNYDVSLWDTAGPEDFDKLRPLSYIGSDVFLLCVDLSYANSLRSGVERWVEELSRCAPGVPIMLCGTKMDLRTPSVRDSIKKKSKQFNPVTFDVGSDVARSIGAVAYAETSALTGVGVAKAFEEVIRIGCTFSQLSRGGGDMSKKCGLM
jgi:small GTP-binding protein